MKNNKIQKALFMLFLVTLLFQLGCKKGNIDPLNQYKGRILYVKNVDFPKSAEIWTSNFDGTDTQNININLPQYSRIITGSNVILSQDKKTIYFAVSIFGGANQRTSIFSCNIDGSNLKEIVQPYRGAAPELNDIKQNKILYTQVYPGFVGNDPSTLTFWMANTDGTNAQVISIKLSANGYNIYSRPKFSSDGKALFYQAYDNNGSTAKIFKINTDGTGLSTIFQYPQDLGFISLSGVFTIANQSKLVFIGGTTAANLWVMNVDGSSALKINIDLPANVKFSLPSPVVSDDGKKIFFNTRNNQYQYQIYSCNTDGSNVQLIIPVDALNHSSFIGDTY